MNSGLLLSFKHLRTEDRDRSSSEDVLAEQQRLLTEFIKASWLCHEN